MFKLFSKMKVLLLHGYLQNGDIIHNTIQKLFSKTVLKQNNIELISPHGIYKIDENKFGWWKLESKEMFCQPHNYENVEEAISYIKNLNISNIDVIIGFSQGAVFTSILVGMKIFVPKLVILMSGSDIMDSKYQKEIINIPSIHIVGKNDTLCYEKYSLDLAARYNKSLIQLYHEHRWGHVIPSTGELRSILLNYLKQYM